MTAIATFSVQDILDNVLEHLYTIRIEENNSTPLCSAALVARSWTRAAQKLLHRRLIFNGNLQGISKWLEVVDGAAGGGVFSGFESFQIVLVSDSSDPLERGSREYELVAKMMKKVKGVEKILWTFTSDQTIPSEWLTGENLRSSLVSLIISSPLSTTDSSTSFEKLRFFAILDQRPELSRDWSDTFASLAHWSKSLVTVDFAQLSTYPRYLVPRLPLENSPLSIQRTLFPFADQLVSLSLPFLLPSTDLYNLAIFGVACRCLERLHIEELTSLSASSVPILRFFPNIELLSIETVIGLPHVVWLQPEQVQFLEDAGQGNVLVEIAKLFLVQGMSNLKVIQIAESKYFYDEHLHFFQAMLDARGGGQFYPPSRIPLTEKELQEAEEIKSEFEEIQALEHKRRILEEIRLETMKQMEELEELVKTTSSLKLNFEGEDVAIGKLLNLGAGGEGEEEP
ncbi:hypothetical protein JCM3765_006717 [Sporobolomyces pararoseus]